MVKNELNEFKEKKNAEIAEENERIFKEVEKEVSKIKYEKELFIQKCRLEGLRTREIRGLPQIREFDEKIALASIPLRNIKQNKKISPYSSEDE